VKIYSVRCDDGDAPISFATKKEAVAQARKMRGSAPAGSNVEVEELTLVKITKHVIVDLVNCQGGYVEDSRIVLSLPSTQKETR
jgi:hypothetical protein